MSKKIMEDIARELARAKKKHPVLPQHIVSRAAIVCEEAGELVRAALNFKYELSDSEVVRDAQFEQIYTEAVHTAATAIRFLESLKRTPDEYKPKEAHGTGSEDSSPGNDDF